MSERECICSGYDLFNYGCRCAPKKVDAVPLCPMEDGYPPYFDPFDEEFILKQWNMTLRNIR